MERKVASVKRLAWISPAQEQEGVVQEYIIQANIDRFQKLLERELEEKQRAVIAQLLATERARLADLPSELPPRNLP